MDEKTSTRVRPLCLAIVTMILLGSMVRTAAGEPGRPDPPERPRGPWYGVTAASGFEGIKGTRALRFFLKSPIAGPLTYEYTTYDGTATVADGDYLAASGTRSLASGQTEDTLIVYVVGDDKHEKEETFKLAVSGVGYPLIVAIGTIVNDDSSPSISTSNVSTLEGNGGATIVNVPVHIDRPSSTNFVMTYSMLDATASIGDYAAAAGTVVVPAGQKDAVLPVTILGDASREPTEAFIVRFEDPLTMHGMAQSVVTILTDDLAGPPAVTLTRPNGNESFVAGDHEQIAWTSSPDAVVDVLFSRDAGASWITLGTGQYDAGYAYWTVEGGATNHGLIKVVVRDPLGGAAEDVSDAPFVIKTLAGSPDSITSVLVTTSAHAVAEGIELRWQLAADLSARSVTIERRESNAAAWLRIDPTRRNEDAATVALDADVEPGRTYAYRLIVDLGNGEPMRVLLPEVTAGAIAPKVAFTVMPNPSRGMLRIHFTSARREAVRVSLFDVQGREVAVAVAGTFAPGSHAVDWNAPRSIPRGLYFVRCANGGKVLTRRVALVE